MLGNEDWAFAVEGGRGAGTGSSTSVKQWEPSFCEGFPTAGTTCRQRG